MADGKLSRLSIDELEAFRNIREILFNVIRILDASDVDSNVIDALHFRLDWLHGLVIRYFDVFGIDEEVVHLIGSVRDLIAINCSQLATGCPPHHPLFPGDRGRPRCLIPREQIVFLLERCFSVIDIGKILGVSARTVHRRLTEFGLTARSVYSEIVEQDLDNIVLAILREFPNWLQADDRFSAGQRVTYSAAENTRGNATS